MLRSLERDGGRARGRPGRPGGGSSAPPRAAFDRLGEDILRPIAAALPRHPLLLTRFGPAGAAPGDAWPGRSRAPRRRALFAGVAAHGFAPVRPALQRLGRDGADLRLPPLSAGRSPGRLGGDRRRAGGGRASRTAAGSRPAGRSARSTSCRPPTRSSSTSRRGAVAEIAGDRLPARVARAYRRYRHGPGAFKVDLAVEGGVPWTDEASRPGRDGPRDRLLRGDRRRRARGRPRPDARAALRPRRPAVPRRPVALARRRPPGLGLRPRPPRLPGRRDRGDPRPDRTLRARPRERILATPPAPPAELAAHNANYVGGDIIDRRQHAVADRDPPAARRSTPTRPASPGVYICSAATPPGAGAHGMGGYNAALSALRHLAPDGPAEPRSRYRGLLHFLQWPWRRPQTSFCRG